MERGKRRKNREGKREGRGEKQIRIERRGERK